MDTALSPMKKTGKHDRERKVLLGLVDYYIKTGKPVGSNTLKEVGFADLSAATIRNYFASLEDDGYLVQQHASGGRIPTAKAYKLYAAECMSASSQKSQKGRAQTSTLKDETRAINKLLQEAAEQLAPLAKTAVFLSAPRFEQDFIIGIKVVPIDATRCLCILITDFGDVKTETLYLDNKLGTLSSKRIEAYFNWRLNNQQKPEGLTPEEEELGKKLYNELLVRYVVGYSEFDQEDIYRTGFSTLLSHNEFQDPGVLANTLSLFENTHGMRQLLKECCRHNTLKLWIGDDLMSHSPKAHPECAVIAIPFHVNNQPVGAIGLLGPQRLPYHYLFDLLNNFSSRLSDILTRSLYKFKITLKPPRPEAIDLKQRILIGETRKFLLEDKSAETARLTTSKKKNSQKNSPRRK